MADGCCHPATGPHRKGEPSTCCHVHVEDLPANRDAQQGEPLEPEHGWTAQEQHRENELIAAIHEERSDGATTVHRHKI